MTMTRFERWSVWTTTAGTLLTGVVYWWMSELMSPTDPFAVINHPLQPWVLKAHILIAPLQIFSVGLITSRHIWRHFRMGVRKGRRSGMIAAVMFIAMVATGYGLQVLTAELLLRIVGWTHLVVGIVYSVGVAVHWPATRQKSQPQDEARPRPLAEGTLGRAAAFGGSGVPGHERRRRTATRRAGLGRNAEGREAIGSRPD
ncbi:MAG: hypothetical protein R3314_02000 [Longimicrobiales bacterium]|nr:hypothetical protein [Longimicrobiales bacterium]